MNQVLIALVVGHDSGITSKLYDNIKAKTYFWNFAQENKSKYDTQAFLKYDAQWVATDLTVLPWSKRTSLQKQEWILQFKDHKKDWIQFAKDCIQTWVEPNEPKIIIQEIDQIASNDIPPIIFARVYIDLLTNTREDFEASVLQNIEHWEYSGDLGFRTAIFYWIK